LVCGDFRRGESGVCESVDRGVKDVRRRCGLVLRGVGGLFLGGPIDGDIEPERGDEFEPMRHEAVMQQADEEVEPGCIVAVFQKGYTLADRTIRPSKVSVRPAEDASGNETSEGNDNADV